MSSVISIHFQKDAVITCQGGKTKNKSHFQSDIEHKYWVKSAIIPSSRRIFENGYPCRQIYLDGIKYILVDTN